MFRIALAATVIAIASIGRASSTDAPVAEPPNVFFGLLHAHTAFSDWSGTPKP